MIEHSWLLIFEYLHILNISYHCLLICQVSVDISTASLIDLPLSVREFCSLTAFLTIFHKINHNRLGVGLLLFILMAVLCVSWMWMSVSFPILETCTTVVSPNKCSACFSSGIPVFWMLLYLMDPLTCLNLYSCRILSLFSSPSLFPMFSLICSFASLACCSLH